MYGLTGKEKNGCDYDISATLVKTCVAFCLLTVLQLFIASWWQSLASSARRCDVSITLSVWIYRWEKNLPFWFMNSADLQCENNSDKNLASKEHLCSGFSWALTGEKKKVKLQIHNQHESPEPLQNTCWNLILVNHQQSSKFIYSNGLFVAWHILCENYSSNLTFIYQVNQYKCIFFWIRAKES